jgi:hypothetical protein
MAKKVICGSKSLKAINGSPPPKGSKKLGKKRFGPAPIGFGRGYLRGPTK